jgi:hypothetical protein
MGLLELALGGSRAAEQRGGARKLRPLIRRRHAMPTQEMRATPLVIGGLMGKTDEARPL